MLRYLVPITSILFTAIPSSPFLADTIRLLGGGLFRGQVLEEESTSKTIVLQRGKGKIKIPRGKIQAVIHDKTPLEAYVDVKKRYANTIEDQFKLAMWCDQNKLMQQRREHLLVVIELDPDHVLAREKLGYEKHDGEWLTRHELKEANGLTRYRGRYVTPQEKETLEEKQRQKLAKRQWYKKIRTWKDWLTSDDTTRTHQAKQKLRGIQDPLAVEPLVRQFKKEKSDSIRVLLCEILGGVPGEQATQALVMRAIAEPSSSARWPCTTT